MNMQTHILVNGVKREQQSVLHGLLFLKTNREEDIILLSVCSKLFLLSSCCSPLCASQLVAESLLHDKNSFNAHFIYLNNGTWL